MLRCQTILTPLQALKWWLLCIERNFKSAYGTYDTPLFDTIRRCLIYHTTETTKLVKGKRGSCLSLTASGPCHEDMWERTGIAPPFLISAADDGEQSASHSCHCTPRERAPVTQCIGGWEGPHRQSAYYGEETILVPARNWTLANLPMVCHYSKWHNLDLYETVYQK